MKNTFYLGETKDYSKFNFVEGNRDIIDANVNKIEKSIKEMGVQCPILVDDSYKIIDGQHRFIALRRNGLVVPYIVSQRATTSDVDKLQESVKWKALDFARNRAVAGDISCKEALKIADEWFEESNKKMLPIRSLELLMDGNGALKTKIRNNSYLINKEVADDVWEAINVMSEYPMATTPFGQKIVRALKMIRLSIGKLDLEVVSVMTDKNHIKAYSSETEQYDYMLKLYERASKALCKRVNRN